MFHVRVFEIVVEMLKTVSNRMPRTRGDILTQAKLNFCLDDLNLHLTTQGSRNVCLGLAYLELEAAQWRCSTTAKLSIIISVTAMKENKIHSKTLNQGLFANVSMNHKNAI